MSETKKEQATRWQRVWAQEVRVAEAAGEWKRAEYCRESVRVWAGRAAEKK